MIKRSYFISVEKYFGDRTGSHRHTSFVFSYKSLIPNHDAAFKAGLRAAEEIMKDSPGKTHKVVAFNRL